MKYADIHTLQQVRVSNTVWRFIKKKAEHERVSMGELYNEALKKYLRFRRQNKHHYFLVASGKDKYRSLWLKTTTLNSAQRMAARDGVSVNSIIFSAFVVYYYDHQPVDFETGLKNLPQKNNSDSV